MLGVGGLGGDGEQRAPCATKTAHAQHVNPLTAGDSHNARPLETARPNCFRHSLSVRNSYTGSPMIAIVRSIGHCRGLDVLQCLPAMTVISEAVKVQRNDTGEIIWTLSVAG